MNDTLPIVVGFADRCVGRSRRTLAGHFVKCMCIVEREGGWGSMDSLGPMIMG